MKKMKALQFSALLVPFGLACVAAKEKSVVIGLVSVVCLYVAVHIMPVCRKRENMWVFFLAAPELIPVNIAVFIRIIRIVSFGSKPSLSDYLWGLLICFVLFCVEEIILGIAARLIWKKQYMIGQK